MLIIAVLDDENAIGNPARRNGTNPSGNAMRWLADISESKELSGKGGAKDRFGDRGTQTSTGHQYVERHNTTAQ